MKLRNPILTVGLIAGGGALLYWLVKNKLNPFSDQNLAYQTTNKIAQIITGDKGATTGGAIYDLFHGNVYDVYAYSTKTGHAVPSQYIRRSDGKIFAASELSSLVKKTG